MLLDFFDIVTDEPEPPPIVKIPKVIDPEDIEAVNRLSSIFESRSLPMNILDFSMEIIIEIFKFLNPGDLNAVSLTCSKFLEATKYYHFTRQRTLYLHKINFSDDQPQMTDFLNTPRYFTNLYFTFYVVRLKDSNYFWMLHGSFVRTLTLKLCIIKKDKFLEILWYLPNLEELTIYDCNELLNRWQEEDTDSFKPRLAELKKLNLFKINVLHPHVFDYLFDMCPNIEHLSVVDCFMECSDSRRRVEMVNHCLLSLNRMKSQLKCLDLLRTPVDDLTLANLAGIEGLHLRHFSLTFMGRISNPGILDFLKIQTGITVLDLSDSLNLLDHCLFLICTRMTQLKVLKVKRCIMITDFGIKEVVRLKSLEVLDVSGCERITDHGFSEGIVGRNWKEWKENLSELYLSSNNAFTEYTLAMTTTVFSHLVRLDISSSTNCVTDYSIQLINRYLTKLRYLNLDYCGQVSDAGITGIGFIDERSTSMYTYPITRLKGLQTLKMSGVYQISDASLNQFNFLELKELTLACCQLITEDGITNVAKNCPSLEVLDLTECQNVTDFSMEIMTNYLRRLRVLKVICCNQLTDLSIDSITTNCEALKSLYIRGCFQISFDALQKLNYLPSLKYIHSN